MSLFAMLINNLLEPLKAGSCYSDLFNLLHTSFSTLDTSLVAEFSSTFRYWIAAASAPTI